jgi:hypothetical protein
VQLVIVGRVGGDRVKEMVGSMTETFLGSRADSSKMFVEAEICRRTVGSGGREVMVVSTLVERLFSVLFFVDGVILHSNIL